MTFALRFLLRARAHSFGVMGLVTSCGLRASEEESFAATFLKCKWAIFRLGSEVGSLHGSLGVGKLWMQSRLGSARVIASSVA